jgi:hypothetical protein
MTTGESSDQRSPVWDEVRACLLAPSRQNLERAAELLDGIDRRFRSGVPVLSRAETADILRELSGLRTLGEQAAKFYWGIEALLKSKPASYAASGEPALPAGHQLSLEG